MLFITRKRGGILINEGRDRYRNHELSSGFRPFPRIMYNVNVVIVVVPVYNDPANRSRVPIRRRYFV